MKHSIFALAALVATVFAACSTDATQDLAPEIPISPNELFVSFDEEDTRVQLQNGTPVWTDGDLVSVFNRSNANDKYQFIGNTGDADGSIKLTETGTATVATARIVAVYPYSDSYWYNWETHDVEAFLPVEQTYLKDSYGVGSSIMIASSEYKQLSFKNVCGWLKLQFTGTGSQKVERIVLRGNSGEQVAGKIYINSTDASCSLAADMGSDDDEGTGGAGGTLIFDDTIFSDVTLNCGDGITLSQSATAFYIALPPQTFENGITIEVSCTDGSVMAKSTSNTLTITRNHIQPMECIAYNGIVSGSLEYTTNDGKPLDPYTTEGYGADFKENIFDPVTGNGTLLFDGQISVIPTNAFLGCANLERVNLSGYITSIGNEAFALCESLTDINLCRVEHIEDNAFRGCSSLTTITIPYSVKHIGVSAFMQCNALTSFCGKFASGDNRCLIIDGTLNSFAPAGLTQYSIPNSVTSIGTRAFYNCSALTSFNIPESVTSIGEAAFTKCSALESFYGKFASGDNRCLIIDGTLNSFAPAGLTEYVIYDDITTIESYAFADCSKQTSITIPENVTAIGNKAFYNCSSLKDVYCSPIIPPIAGAQMFDNCASEFRICTDRECVDAYKVADGWREYKIEAIPAQIIKTAEELLDFAKCVNKGRYNKFINENGEVVLGNDIDMSTLTEWVPVVGPVSADTGFHTGFDGFFNGQGYSITNWVTTQPLFGYISAGAVVKNLVIADSCDLVIPEVSPYSLDGNPASNLCFAFVVASNMAGTVENVINHADVRANCPDDSLAQTRAAIVGWTAPGGYIRNCINNGDFTLELKNHTVNTAYIGTVSGRFQSSAETVPSGIYDCENHGDLTINIGDAATSKNFYIGGVTGSSKSYTVTSGCKNYGDVTFNTSNSGALVCLAGVTPYSAGDIIDCYNEGNISHNSTGQLKGAIICGVVAYQNGNISGCVNKGNVYSTGTTFGGRNSVGSITTDKAASSAAPAVCGVVGYMYLGNVDNCENYGNLEYDLTAGDGSGTSGRTLMAGVVGSQWGYVAGCKNYGQIKHSQKYTTTQANHLTYVGGVVGCDYYAKSQMSGSITDCVNEGEILYHNDLGTSNSAVGGIVGWPGTESRCTNITERCVNKGNIVVSGQGKVRLGGIQGGSGQIVDCQNTGSITVNETNSGSVYGGLAGFHSGGYLLTGSTTTGDIVVNVPVSAGGVGGIMGNVGNSEHKVGKIANNTVNCLVRAAEGTCGVGMVIGHFNGKTMLIYFGDEANPIVVGGKLQIGDAVTVIDASNVADPALLGGTGCANYLADYHHFSTVLAQ